MTELIGTLALMTAIQVKIGTLEWTSGVQLFEKVELYHEPNLPAALADLRLFASRICLIVPSGEVYEYEPRGRDLHLTVWRELVLLFADRDRGKRMDALTGDADRPGVLKMKDLIEDQLTGQHLGFTPKLPRLHPVEGQGLHLTAEEKEVITQRSAWTMVWRCRAGTKIVNELS